MLKRFGIGAIGVTVCLGIGLMTGLGAYTFDYAEGTSYLSNDPEACINCHVMRDVYNGWQRSTHHAVAVCNDCHVPQSFIPKMWTKAVHGYRHSKGFTFQDFHEPIQIGADSLAVVEDNCRRCHESLVEDILYISAPAGASHGEGLECVHCHSHVGHGPRR